MFSGMIIAYIVCHLGKLSSKFQNEFYLTLIKNCVIVVMWRSISAYNASLSVTRIHSVLITLYKGSYMSKNVISILDYLDNNPKSFDAHRELYKRCWDHTMVDLQALANDSTEAELDALEAEFIQKYGSIKVEKR